TASVAQIVGSLWGAIAFLFLCEQTVDAPEIRFYVYYINIVLIGLYGLFLYLYKRRKVSAPGLATLAFLVVFVEMTLNMGITSITTTGRSAYLKNTDNFVALSQWADNEEGGNFFRMEKAVKKTKNDGSWADYRSASIFSSTTNAAITKIYKQLGMEGSTNAYSFTGATPFIHSLLSVKYTLSTDEIDGPLTTLVQLCDGVNLYRNDHVLPLGFMIPSGATTWNHTDPNPIQVQNSFVSNTTSVHTLFTQVTSGNSNSYTFTASQDGYYYGVLTDFSVKNIKATFEEKSTTYSNVNRDFVLDLGYMHAGEQVTLAGEDKKMVSVNIYRLLEGNYTEAMAQLREQPLVVTSYSDTEIQATIDVKKAGILFTSIPYEEGWTVSVNGIPTETKAFADAFVSIDLPAGQHTITMSYMPVGLREGAIISLASLAILMIIILVHLICYFRKRHQTAADRNEMRIPVAEPVQAKPSQASTLTAKPSYADRIRPVDESLRREEPASPEDRNMEDTIVSESSAESQANIESVIPEATATQDADVSPSAAPDAVPTVQPTGSDSEKNPRLLAFEQLMKDLGGRIE
ncbi:MAG: YfhO family protein, partial [Lachnospiraceae bacterium]|nr:YfhO family protein [Lachnospiraceae bacterium]